jgi:capsular polysaccharide transport system permease protein
MNLLRTLSARRLAVALVAVPFVAGAIYYGLVAADRYVSESTIAVRQANQDMSSTLPGAAVLLGGALAPSREDTLYVQEYVHSLGLLLKLDEQLKLREHFQGAGADRLFALAADAPQEDFLAYYRERVEVSFDDVASLLTVRAQGFDPAFAQALNRAILAESERFVNAFSQQIATEQLRFAETELRGAAQRVESAQTKVLAFQTRHRLIDPVAQAQASGALTADLQSQLTRLETELKSLASYLNDEAYQVKALKAQIAATRAQLDAERDRITAESKQGERLTALSIDFQSLQLQSEFARDAYKLALSAVENARIEANRKLKSLVVIEPPSLPQIAEYPRRLYNLLTLLVASLLTYLIARLLVATIREHQD